MRKVLGVCSVLALCASTAQAAPIAYYTSLTGAAEFPAVVTPATGFARVVYDDAARTLLVHVIFSGLTSNNTAAHIHCCVSPSAANPTVGVATQTPTFAGFPAGTAGAYLNTFDLTQATSFRAGFITANGGTPATAEATLALGLASGFAYLNIHSTTNPGGEIRGFLQPVPEPATLSLVGGALGALWTARRRRRS